MMKNCGNCDYCAENGEYLVCVNDQSEYLYDFVTEEHVCDEWEGSEEDADE